MGGDRSDVWVGSELSTVEVGCTDGTREPYLGFGDSNTNFGNRNEGVETVESRQMWVYHREHCDRTVRTSVTRHGHTRVGKEDDDVFGPVGRCGSREQDRSGVGRW